MSLTYELDGEANVAEIAFDDGKANVMSTEWFRELNGLLDRAEKDEAVAVLFRGRSGMFSGGLNMKWLPTLSPEEGRELVDTFSSTMLRVFGLPIPTVAAVTGHAVAGGCVLSSACDQRFCLEGPYRIQMNEVLVGMAMPTWAAVICQGAWPVPAVNDLLLLGRPFSPAEAVACGAFHAAEPSETALLARARATAKAMARVGSGPYRNTKARLRGPEIERARALVFGE
jgi:enoyl-CoA hydratase